AKVVSAAVWAVSFVVVLPVVIFSDVQVENPVLVNVMSLKAYVPVPEVKTLDRTTRHSEVTPAGPS
ncbi:hypothetical protein, partial [Streptococcus pyogenes]|uniref:hypothetical protein n=1 Tax=Streptococcus pyogenes TaxID=1314 RepID=UPI003D9FB8CD